MPTTVDVCIAGWHWAWTDITVPVDQASRLRRHAQPTAAALRHTYFGLFLVQSNLMTDREPGTRNSAASWSEFDAHEYWKNNYASVLPEDEQIIRCASNFLIEACSARSPFRRAVDVGAGTNLYPALLMLPWTEHIFLTEYSPANIDWLSANLADAPGEWVWQPFWNLMAGLPGYENVEQPRHRLATSHGLHHLSIFHLPRRTWDLGSMFFVADGITSDEAEFESAVRSFINALTPSAPFMMAFMEGSSGYDVSGVSFPAVKVTLESLSTLLAGLPVTGAKIVRTDNSARQVRTGYDAMLLATGYVAETRFR
jgi:NNMT/PNMT/TEMT family